MQSRLTAELAVLLVDDERQTLKYFERAFAKDFAVLTAASADEAEAIVDASPGKIGVIISDQRMPGRTGVSLLNAVRRKHPGIVRMLTTAYSELDDAIEAVNRGEIFRYIVKPWDFDLLRQEVNTGLLVYSLQAERDLLIGEKLIVRQRMVAVDRTRDLAVIVSSLPQLRYGPLAVDDYVRDSAAGLAAAAPTIDTAGLDLWSLPQAETRHMSDVAARAAAVAGAAGLTGAPAAAALADGVRTAIAAVTRLAGEAQVRIVDAGAPAQSVGTPAEVLDEIIAATLAAIVASVREGGEVTIAASNAATVNGTPGASVTITGTDAASRPDGLLYGSASRAGTVEPGRLFAAYLAARECGGSIKLTRGAETVDAQILLPFDPSKAAPPAPRTDWLDRLFQHFEAWPA
jgi:two-component system probable response regulator PhcQ